MTIKHHIKYFLIVFGIFVLLPLKAQQGVELGGWIGTSYYFGDLNTKFDLMHPGPGAGLIGRYNFNTRLCLKFSANYGFIRADDVYSENAYERRRNINFRSHIGDFSGQFEFNFFPYIHGSRDKNFTPYLFAGFSAFYYNPYAVYDGEKTPSLRDLGTEGQFRGEEYSTFETGLNFGGGLKLDITEEWSLNFELSLRKLFTDYLDDVSTTYPDPDDIQAYRPNFTEIALLASDPSLPDAEGNKLGMPGRQRGNSKDNDSYNFFQIGLLYYFGNLKCPKISENY